MTEHKAGGVRSGGVGVASLLGLLFVGLKLGGIIGWSWWWVVSPFWIPPVLAIVIIITLLSVAAIVAAIATYVNK